VSDSQGGVKEVQSLITRDRQGTGRTRDGEKSRAKNQEREDRKKNGVKKEEIKGSERPDVTRVATEKSTVVDKDRSRQKAEVERVGRDTERSVSRRGGEGVGVDKNKDQSKDSRRDVKDRSVSRRHREGASVNKDGDKTRGSGRDREGASVNKDGDKTRGSGRDRIDSDTSISRRKSGGSHQDEEKKEDGGKERKFTERSVSRKESVGVASIDKDKTRESGRNGRKDSEKSGTKRDTNRGIDQEKGKLKKDSDTNGKKIKKAEVVVDLTTRRKEGSVEIIGVLPTSRGKIPVTTSGAAGHLKTGDRKRPHSKSPERKTREGPDTPGPLIERFLDHRRKPGSRSPPGGGGRRRQDSPPERKRQRGDSVEKPRRGGRSRTPDRRRGEDRSSDRRRGGDGRPSRTPDRRRPRSRSAGRYVCTVLVRLLIRGPIHKKLF